MIIENFAGLPLAQYNIFKNFPLVHCITTKAGGFSEPPYKSLNLGLHVQDTQSNVVNNRKLLCTKLGLDFQNLTTCAQVHGTSVVKVTKANAGQGRDDFNTTIPDCDALITNEIGIPLLLFFADCTPILIYDKQNHAIGVAHAGWRGTVGNIVGNTIAAMAKAYGTNPQNCFALVGNSIGKCCYEIGEELVAIVKTKRPTDYNSFLTFHEEKNKYHLDLWKYNETLLLEAAVPSNQIEIAGVCTNCNHEQFFSYRHDHGKTGRIGALMCLK